MHYRSIALALVMILFSSAISANGKKITKIVLDAGHGGKDIGARGQFSQEKDITLAVVLKLGKIMADSMRDVQVIYTRTDDSYPTLVDRHEIANKSNADLFIAVHVNSTAYTYTRVQEGTRTVKKGHKRVRVPVYKSIRHHETAANGVETYVLGLKRNSQKENAIGEYSDNVTDEPGLLDEKDPETSIIIAQYSQAFLKRSITLGTKIQQQFGNEGRADLGVKQMSLEVLAGSAMPGVLVEIGFINNPTEETYLNSEAGQWQVAHDIYRGIRAYKADVEK
ncbi:MAG: N-acetylmuramoyl-L-alanine amidase [Flavipsychrobacter sp.]|nr:N-acetylmuramoyl-L-alanine amidase [Flavipsychrobacter sp.]